MIRIPPAVLAAAALLASTGIARAQDDVLPEGGIPVTSDAVVRACGSCHQRGDDGLMSRISYMRKTPEGWQASVRRMAVLNGVELEPDAARQIVRYLSDRHGLAPEELRPARFEVERRTAERVDAPEAVRSVCSSCHSLGRVVTQRRTAGEWELLAETHRGYFPLIDRQVFRRGGPTELDDGREFDYPVEAANALLAEAYPLRTPEWADWSANRRPARIAGSWAVSGRETGRGAFYGRMELAPVQGRPDAFTTRTTYTYPREDRTVTRTGDGLVYTGYQWRGRSSPASGSDAELREVLFLERDRSRMHGRWFTGAYEELGADVELVPVGTEPIVSGAYPRALRAGTTARVTLYGANLPADLAARDVELGAGVRVLEVSGVEGDRATLQVEVEPDAAAGARDLAIPGAMAPGAVVVYDRVHFIRVEPERGMARIGGVNFPKQLERFEAVGYHPGADAEPDTDDDVRIGAVPAAWRLLEYPRTFGDDDVEFVGELDPSGVFTPAEDGPNPERSGDRNNIGEVWVQATHVREDDGSALRARGYLLVTVPLYIRWDPVRPTRERMLSEGGRR